MDCVRIVFVVVCFVGYAQCTRHFGRKLNEEEEILRIAGGTSVVLDDDQFLVIDSQTDAPMIGLGLGHLLIGADNRKLVSNTQIAPFSSIGQVGEICSGTVIGPRHILTAAHCVYKRSTQEYLSDLDFSPGKDGKEMPFGTYEWEFVLVQDQFKSLDFTAARKADYALIILKNELDPQIGRMPFGNTCANGDKQFSVNLNIVGYPSDLIKGKMYTTGCETLQLNCDWEIFEHLCDTYEGMSGSSMFVAYYKSDGSLGFSIKAVHTSGLLSRDRIVNSGVLITDKVEKQIRTWIEQHP